MFYDPKPETPLILPRPKPERDKHGRWLSSGNPYGRPRKLDTIGFDENLHIFGKTIVEVKIGGKTVPMTRSEAINHKLYQEGMNRNDMRALLALKKGIEKDDNVMSSILAESLNMLTDLHHAKSGEEREDIGRRIKYAADTLEATMQQLAMKNVEHNRKMKAKSKRLGRAFMKKHPTIWVKKED